MRKVILSVTLALAAMSANAQWHHGGGYYRHGGPGIGWAFPALVGGVIGYEIAKQPAPVVVQQPPVVVQPQVMTDPNLVIVNGVLYRKVMMQVNGTYQEVLVRP